ncbi:short-chain collagen C4-like [Mytilus edulis]|uniref:short-chain collagen C4-like n=1 Tax=Mytilus edulis TaxID=6550 RepID=UPI0039EEC78B
MYLLFVTFVLAIVLLGVHNHECKDYNLSASDQSLIDMMKHYLHTSRREECPTQSKTSNTGVTYVRWGKKNCPKGTDTVYTGQAGGNYQTHKGGGVNYLCLPNDPENGQHQSYDNAQVYGGEYEVSSTSKPSGWSGSMSSKEVPCSVCYRKHRSAVLMIPGRKTCYKGWNSEYNGYLMSDHNVYSNKDYVCVDKNAEPLDNKNGDENGALFYTLRTKCGSLRCPPYTNEADVLCVVCTKSNV